jgi:rhodanese-related sulfurtransferase
MKKVIIFAVLIIAAFAAGVLATSKPSSGNSNTKVLGKQQAYSHLTPEQFDTALSTGEYTLIDIRTTDEFNSGHLKNALQNDYYQTQQFSSYLDSLDKNKKYLMYCRTGHRSGLAMGIMQQKGFANVSDLSGGITAWTASGLPTE